MSVDLSLTGDRDETRTPVARSRSGVLGWGGWRTRDRSLVMCDRWLSRPQDFDLENGRVLKVGVVRVSQTGAGKV